MKKIHFTLGSIDTVVGVCENCEEDTVLVAVVTDYYRCTNCGADTRQHINGKISYIPVITNRTPKSQVEKYFDGEES